MTKAYARNNLIALTVGSMAFAGFVANLFIQPMMT